MPACPVLDVYVKDATVLQVSQKLSLITEDKKSGEPASYRTSAFKLNFAFITTFTGR